MKKQNYDIIGDIHGQHDKLTGLLGTLGYESRGCGFRHPEGRKVIFLGDYIDRGPKVREVLLTVRSMVASGDALAIMGNHEYNAICYHTPDGKGGWLRERRLDRDCGLRVSLAQFAGRESEWTGWLAWMRRLPMFLDLGGIRAVHACWDHEGIERLTGQTLADDKFLNSTAVRGSPTHRAADHVLKGPEMAMPDDRSYHDKEGKERHLVRVRWWDIPDQVRISHLAMPVPFDVPGDAPEHELRRVPNYPADAPPVFFGHYWMPACHAKAPLRHNIACLDYSAAREGPLVAYRWDGESKLTASKFISHTTCTP